MCAGRHVDYEQYRRDDRDSRRMPRKTSEMEALPFNLPDVEGAPRALHPHARSRSSAHPDPPLSDMESENARWVRTCVVGVRC